MPASRLARYLSLTRLDKPVGIALLLWPTLDALWIAAGGWPGARNLAVFVAGTVLTRSAGCVVNDMADRRFDAHVERTAGRVLARGLVSAREALALAVVLGLGAAALLPLLAAAAWPLALVAAAVAVSYPFFKRFFPLPQAWLGIAFSFGIPMAFAALAVMPVSGRWPAVDEALLVAGHLPGIAWMLFGANLFWVMAYDTEYAMVDRPDDLRIGVRSSAIFFGRADVAAVALCYAAYLGLMAWIAARLEMGLAFAAAWLVALGCALVHVAWIRTREPARCFRAFRHNHWLGLALFTGIVADYALRA